MTGWLDVPSRISIDRLAEESLGGLPDFEDYDVSWSAKYRAVVTTLERLTDD